MQAISFCAITNSLHEVMYNSCIETYSLIIHSYLGAFTNHQQ